MARTELIGCEINGRKFVFYGSEPEGWIIAETAISFAAQYDRSLRGAGDNVDVICYDGGEHCRKIKSGEYITFSEEDYPCFFVTARR